RTARVDRLSPNFARIGCRIGSLQDGKSLAPCVGIKFTHNVPIRHGRAHSQSAHPVRSEPCKLSSHPCFQLPDVQTLYDIEKAPKAAASLRCKLKSARALTLPW